MRRLEILRNDFSILRQMLRGMPRHATHAQRLQGFYAGQAGDYDRFRERLLPGRAELIRRLQLPPRARVVELGGGTGRNLEFFGRRIDDVASFDLVDLCPALLDRARRRLQHCPQVHIVDADATTFQPDAPVDCVYFSFALTMIPDWRAALANALRMLKPGGILGVVDFYISQAQPAPGLMRHASLTRAFWRRWFAHDGVHLDPEHLAELRRCLPAHTLLESHAPVPYLPGLRVPYYILVGHKPALAAS